MSMAPPPSRPAVAPATGEAEAAGLAGANTLPSSWKGYAQATPVDLSVLTARRGRRLCSRVAFVLVPIIALAAATTPIAARLVPKTSPTCDGPGCVPRPSPPVGAEHSYESTRYGFSLGYFNDPVPPTSTRPAPGKLLLSYDDLVGGGPAWIIFGAVRDRTQSAEAVADAVLAGSYPGAHLAYELWNPMIGYQPGYGAVYDYSPESGNASAIPERVIVVAAVKRDLAIVAVAAGPYDRFSDSFPGGHPISVDTVVGLLIDDPLNTVRWPGDPPR